MLLLLLPFVTLFVCGCGGDSDGSAECDAGVECEDCEECTDCDGGPPPVQIPQSWDQITAGGGWAYYGNYYGAGPVPGFTCGISSGQLWCWGVNSYGQLGVTPSAATSVPFRVGTDADWEQVSAGFEHTCGIRGGALYCWGANAAHNDGTPFYGRLGLGATYDGTELVDTPTRVGTGTDWTQVACGKSHSCGVRGGAVYCWGRNQQGQLGDANGGTDSDVPVQENSAATDWVMVTANRYHGHSCGIRDDGTDRTLWCWGDNGYGQLGLGDSTDYDTPQQVGAATDWAVVTAGGRYSCGLRDDGTDQTLWCWGRNSWGQLGVDDTSDYDTPQQVGSATDWVDVSAGKSATCGISGGDLYCWGKNSYLQCGLGTDLSGLTSCTEDGYMYYCQMPELADDTATWLDVEIDGAHTCGLASDGLYCWGANHFGQAGQPSGALIPVPTPVN
jgi:alpha-tubulin suppressor-like RCC1 family protein